MRTGWQVPALLADALLGPELVRPFWAQLKVAAEAPHQRARQVVDRSHGKRSLNTGAENGAMPTTRPATSASRTPPPAARPGARPRAGSWLNLDPAPSRV